MVPDVAGSSPVSHPIVLLKGVYERKLGELIKNEHLDKEKTSEFLKKSFEQGYISDADPDILDALEPLSLFVQSSKEKNQKIKQKLIDFFDRFYEIVLNYISVG